MNLRRLDYLCAREALIEASTHLGTSLCYAFSDVFFCQRPYGHSGLHCSYFNGRGFHVWPIADRSSEGTSLS